MEENLTEKVTTANKKKLFLRRYIKTGIWILVIFILFRWMFFDTYHIPTRSMEKTIEYDDYILVSKLHYGARIPMTIMKIPFTFRTIWFTDIPSYIDYHLPTMRLPSFAPVRSGDMVVFNYPGCPERPDQFGGYDQYPIDLRTPYTERCVAVGGDVLEIRDGQVYINGKAMKNAEGIEMSYAIECNTTVNEKVFSKMGINEFEKDLKFADKDVYYVRATQKNIEQLKSADFVKEIYPMLMEKGDTTTLAEVTFPYNTALFPFNRDNFGPVTVPKKGMTIPMNEANIALYKGIITTFDGNPNATYTNGKVLIDGKVISSYTFQQDYYFMLGDNRHASDDSRYWGFVPFDHIIGKVVGVF